MNDATDARFERDLPVAAEVVWRALTDVDRLSVWFDQLIDYGSSRLDFAARSTLLFVAKDNHLLPPLNGRVTRCEPPHRLEYTWGSQTLRWQLVANRGGCRLGLTVTGSMPVDPFRWQACLDRLGTMLDSDTAPWDGVARPTGAGADDRAGRGGL